MSVPEPFLLQRIQTAMINATTRIKNTDRAATKDNDTRSEVTSETMN